MRLVDGHQVHLEGREGVNRERLNKRFRPKFQAAGQDECWIWAASTLCGGHGQFCLYDEFEFRTTTAHRAAYWYFVAKPTEGLHICHRCDNPLCVNPWHLTEQSAAWNTQDMIRKGRAWFQRQGYAEAA